MSPSPRSTKPSVPAMDRLHLWPLFVRAVQLSLFVLAGACAFFLRFDFTIPETEKIHVLYGLLVWGSVKSAVFELFGLGRGWWRFVCLPDAIRIALANLIGSGASALLIAGLAPQGFPRSIYVLDFTLSLVFTIGVRVSARLVFEVVRHRECVSRHATFVYGAGQAGSMLARELREDGDGYDIVGFIDDASSKKGMLIQGVPVLGAGSDLPDLARRYCVSQVLVAMPSAAGSQIAAAVKACHNAGVAFRMVPRISSRIENSAIASQIRDISVEDLLCRAPVKSDETAVSAKLRDQVVLVTGAAGFIGSELCRQIARFRPAAIVGFEIGETALFELDLEMRQEFPHVAFHPEIGSIQNARRVSEVFAKYRPSTVYHAAAYKHVPMMEAHFFEAIENNIFGGYCVAAAAAEFNATDFVLISSDKAVRPSSVMGVTKRVLELLILAMQDGRTKYVAVRFGNVLGSSGSVVPLFKRQIAAGGPVTVTSSDMRRYFMTVSEAVQLVLQAATMGVGGDIFVLDMGEPVRITDLARNLILLSGLHPDTDVKIEFTGIRPGEKLCEEVSALNENTLPTFHEKIKIFAGNGVPARSMTAYLQDLREITASRDTARLVLTLKEIAPDYNPSAHLLRHMVRADFAAIA